MLRKAAATPLVATGIIQHHNNSVNKSTVNQSSNRQHTSILQSLWRKKNNNDNGHQSKLNDPIHRSYKGILHDTFYLLRLTILTIIGLVMILRTYSNGYFHNYRLFVATKDIDDQAKVVVSTLRLLTVPRVTWDDALVDRSKSISTDSDKTRFIYCNVTTDVRGNLGPASVLIQNQTNDWIKDRWQAASDMHGTNIHGQHYVQLDWSYSFEQQLTKSIPKLRNVPIEAMDTKPTKKIIQVGAQPVVLQRIVLDWEAAYSNNYDIQIWNGTSTSDSSSVSKMGWVSIFAMRPKLGSTLKRNVKIVKDKDTFTTTGGTVHTTSWGQSPGVTFPTPLHIIHDISLDDTSDFATESTTDTTQQRFASSKLRILIHTSATGWGVSLWQVQVHGNYVL